MSYTKKIRAGLVPISVSEFVGDEGTIFYDPAVGDLHISDGVTPGGTLLSSGGGGGGLTGYTGSQGEQGNPGPDGLPGPSAYQLATAQGFVGTEAEWLASLAGPAGATGPIGYTGSAGTSAGQSDRLVSGAKEMVLDPAGSLTVPSPISTLFPLVFSAANYVPTVGKPTLTLTDTPWALNGQYAYAPDGRSALALDNIWPTVINPGYESGDAFTFDSSVHGISGFILTITLNSVVQAGPAGWTANVSESAAPVYAPTIESQGAIKLTANTNSLILGTDGSVTVSGAIKQGTSKIAFNENGGTNVYLTPTTDDSTAVFINDISVQAYAKESVGLQVGAGLTALSETHSLLEAEWVNAREADAFTAAPTIRAWQGLESWLAYPILLNSSPDLDPPMAPNLPTIANSAKQAYDLWQNTKSDTTISMVVDDKVWTFNANGELTAQADSTIKTTTGSLQITAGNYLQLNSTDFGQIEIGRYQAGGVVVLGGTNTLTEVDGALKVNDYISQNNTRTVSPLSVTVPGATPTVVFATPNWYTSIKLVIAVEGQLDDDVGLVDHTQTCEATIAATFNTTAEPIISVYGIVYTSPAPLATFTVARNSLTGQIEVTAVNSQVTNAMNVRVHAIQFVSRYN